MSYDLYHMSYLMSYIIWSHGFGLCLVFRTYDLMTRVDALYLPSTGHLLRILIPLEEPPHLTADFWKYIFIPGRPVGFSSFKLLEIYFYPGSPGRAGEIIFLICVSLMKNPGGGIAEHHTLEAVSKSQPLKHNGERALTPAVHCQIRPAITVCDREFFTTSCTIITVEITVKWLIQYAMHVQMWRVKMCGFIFVLKTKHIKQSCFIVSTGTTSSVERSQLQTTSA